MKSCVYKVVYPMCYRSSIIFIVTSNHYILGSWLIAKKQGYRQQPVRLDQMFDWLLVGILFLIEYLVFAL